MRIKKKQTRTNETELETRQSFGSLSEMEKCDKLVRNLIQSNRRQSYWQCAQIITNHTQLINNKRKPESKTTVRGRVCSF